MVLRDSWEKIEKRQVGVANATTTNTGTTNIDAKWHFYPCLLFVPLSIFLLCFSLYSNLLPIIFPFPSPPPYHSLSFSYSSFVSLKLKHSQPEKSSLIWQTTTITTTYSDHTVTPSQNQPKHIRWLKPNSILPRPPPSDLVTPKSLSRGSSVSGHVSLVSLFLSKTPTSSKIRFKTEKKIGAVWLPPEMVVAIFHMRDRPSHGSLGTIVP